MRHPLDALSAGTVMNLHVSHVLGTARIMSPQFWAGLGAGLLVGLLFVLGNYIARRRQ